ncbi:MAG TPA: transcription antitermination factor NusB [Elusimicrobia bacterium]|nr:MAG: transcription antitermination factor NusB [Elusimicrobia bacterium RIFOXYA12_FULL_49_49]OGS08490.1 MAG: transcription antitermination factor NusB [Elusimicrobia bacterium RIFOXYA1_FULL_47_7]OGS11191.1 MAG: transcription antitermination factor NusB [Elusimicrobia bacterium RIFOXYB1_FULL_48_9]OGS16031.1 MAG: transcription antitermination factor NusB [Elusimicrobia bacterium RIFOXYA2_FULL_47_53]OGS25798.1 MAG: transcription antitermination factor NusB [Elusimicrobia bacterium RIFOXYB12_FUL
MGSRRQAREAALQMLYLCDNCGFSPEKLQDSFEESLKISSVSKEFVEQLLFGAWGKKDELDRIISSYAENWALDRMAVIDRNILRLAAFEITDMPETPVSVIIDEAVEIAKKFSTADSGKFVNGILDKLKTARPPHTAKVKTHH